MNADTHWTSQLFSISWRIDIPERCCRQLAQGKTFVDIKAVSLVFETFKNESYS